MKRIVSLEPGMGLDELEARRGRVVAAPGHQREQEGDQRGDERRPAGVAIRRPPSRRRAGSG